LILWILQVRFAMAYTKAAIDFHVDAADHYFASLPIPPQVADSASLPELASADWSAGALANRGK
jgi:hypothetical protein